MSSILSERIGVLVSHLPAALVPPPPSGAPSLREALAAIGASAADERHHQTVTRASAEIHRVHNRWWAANSSKVGLAKAAARTVQAASAISAGNSASAAESVVEASGWWGLQAAADRGKSIDEQKAAAATDMRGELDYLKELGVDAESLQAAEARAGQPIYGDTGVPEA